MVDYGWEVRRRRIRSPLRAPSAQILRGSCTACYCKKAENKVEENSDDVNKLLMKAENKVEENSDDDHLSSKAKLEHPLGGLEPCVGSNGAVSDTTGGSKWPFCSPNTQCTTSGVTALSKYIPRKDF
uniref:Uncharacterized protein n=1 Tax=Oryza rufipogon TaxID=4529 RepID=A0A0E0R6W2_ORYRU